MGKSILVFILAVSSIGCGKLLGSNSSSSNGGLGLSRKPFGACDRKTVTTINLCMEATGPEYNDSGYLDILESSCQSSGGTYSTNNCDVNESLGVCVVAPGKRNETYVTYYPPEYTSDSAKAACAGSNGVFIGR